MGASNKDIYAKLTDALIAEMKTGTVPWTRPWKEQGGSFGMMPLNAATKRPYSGINILLLWMAASNGGYASSGWCTASQAFKSGAIVRKGERATHVLFMKKLVRPKKDDPKEKETIWLARTYCVFNLDQLRDRDEHPDALQWLRRRAGDAKNREDDAEETGFEPLEDAEKIVKRTGAEIRTGKTQAFYDPRNDYIGMPKMKSFEEVGGYYGVLFHELTHWTGHPTRLDRSLKMLLLAKPEYAMEELVAELGAAFLCGRVGLDVVTRSAQYLKSWLCALENDSSLIVKAASAATRAVQFITGETPEDVSDDNTPAPKKKVVKPKQRTRR